MQPTPLDEVKSRNNALFVRLAFAEEMPAAYHLIGELRVEDERDFAFARVFEITRESCD